MSAPVKTPLGQDELRHRTRGLGQRYRTILLLVDGRRPLGEVLAMAYKAGAQTSHFEELVRLGLVEVPSDVAAPEPVDTVSGTLDAPRLTSVELEVAGAMPPAAAREPAAAEPEPLVDEPEPVPDIAPLTVSTPALPAEAGPSQVWGAEQALQAPLAEFEDTIPEVGGKRVRARRKPRLEPALPVAELASDLGQAAVAAPVAIEPPPVAPPAVAPLVVPPRMPPKVVPARYVEPPLDLTDTPREPDWMQVREPAFPVADHARPAPQVSDDELLDMVRELLLDTLRRDTLLFATFATGRVRAAQTHRELISLVWEIERDRAHVRRSRDQLLNLQRARELLGMGNTLVAWDSQPQLPDDE